MSRKIEAPTVEILVIGNELLSGTTLDTNSHWLTKEVTQLGFIVKRKITIRDELDVISQTFKQMIGRRPGWIFSLGGLGPTFDDMTLRGLANALGRKMELNETAAKMLKERYRARSLLYGRKYARVTKASLKMATLPAGAIPLRNTRGSAPGVLIHYDGVRLISLPGVPREMKGIFREQVRPLLQSTPLRNERLERWLYVEGVTESRLAPKIDKTVKKYGERVYVKSHPFGFKKGKSVLKLQIIADSVNASGSKKLLDEVAERLTKSVSSLGGSAKWMKR